MNKFEKDIIQSVADVILDLYEKAPQIDTKVISVDIEDETLGGLMRDLEAGKYPADAWISANENNTPMLLYRVKRKTTNKQKKLWVSDMLNRNFHFVSKKLIDMGYEREPFNSQKFRNFKDVNVYRLFTEKYYSELIAYTKLYVKEQ